MTYPTNDPLRNAYGEIMWWADFRLSQQHGAQQVCETSRSIHQVPDPEDSHPAECCYMAYDLLMAAALVAKQGGFEKEHEQNHQDILKRYWGGEGNQKRWQPSPWDVYGHAMMGSSLPLPKRSPEGGAGQ